MGAAVKDVEALKQSTVFWCLADYKSFSTMDYWQAIVKASPFMLKVRNEKWLPKMQSAMKKTSVDSVGNKRYVFNIKGNGYRLVVLILFTPQRVYIRFVGTHAEYDKIKDIQNI
jgi:mRNA interferase HigB